MDLASLMIVAVATMVFAGAPGPAVIACLISGTVIGPRQTIPFIAGVVAGDLIYLLAAVTGVAAMLREHGHWLYGASVLGGLYLIYTGVESLRSARHLQTRGGESYSGSRLHFREGLLLTAGNPKVLLFYFAVLPNWMPLDRPTISSTALLVATVGTILFVVNWAYALLGRVIHTSLSLERSPLWIERLSGALLTLIGIYICFYGLSAMGVF